MIRYATVNAVRTTFLQPLEAESFYDLVLRHFTEFKLVAPEERDKEPLFIGWEFKPPHKAKFVNNHYSRCNDNCVALHVLVLDVDNDPNSPCQKITWRDAISALDGIRFFAYSSYNHQNPEKHGGVDKFRVLIELSRPIPLAEFKNDGKASIQGGLQRLMPWAAPESWRPSQPFYLPLERDIGLGIAHLGNGDPLDVDAIPLAVYQPVGSKQLDLNDSGQAPTLVHSKGGKATYLKAAGQHIRLTTGKTVSVEALYAELPEGYKARHLPCYSTLREEKKPSSYCYREGRFLIMQDFGASRQQVRYEVVPFVEERVDIKKLEENIARLRNKVCQKK